VINFPDGKSSAFKENRPTQIIQMRNYFGTFYWNNYLHKHFQRLSNSVWSS